MTDDREVATSPVKKADYEEAAVMLRRLLGTVEAGDLTVGTPQTLELLRWMEGRSCRVTATIPMRGRVVAVAYFDGQSRRCHTCGRRRATPRCRTRR